MILFLSMSELREEGEGGREGGSEREREREIQRERGREVSVYLTGQRGVRKLKGWFWKLKRVFRQLANYVRKLWFGNCRRGFRKLWFRNSNVGFGNWTGGFRQLATHVIIPGTTLPPTHPQYPLQHRQGQLLKPTKPVAEPQLLKPTT